MSLLRRSPRAVYRVCDEEDLLTDGGLRSLDDLLSEVDFESRRVEPSRDGRPAETRGVEPSRDPMGVDARHHRLRTAAALATVGAAAALALATAVALRATRRVAADSSAVGAQAARSSRAPAGREGVPATGLSGGARARGRSGRRVVSPAVRRSQAPSRPVFTGAAPATRRSPARSRPASSAIAAVATRRPAITPPAPAASLPLDAGLAQPLPTTAAAPARPAAGDEFGFER